MRVITLETSHLQIDWLTGNTSQYLRIFWYFFNFWDCIGTDNWINKMTRLQPGFYLSVLITLLFLVQTVFGILRYSDLSCSDFVPRNVDSGNDNGQDYAQYYGSSRFGEGGSWASRYRIRNRYGKKLVQKKRSIGGLGEGYSNEPPYKISVTGRRYRRNSDLLGEWKGTNYSCHKIHELVYYTETVT